MVMKQYAQETQLLIAWKYEITFANLIFKLLVVITEDHQEKMQKGYIKDKQIFCCEQRTVPMLQDKGSTLERKLQDISHSLEKQNLQEENEMRGISE